MQHRMRNCKSQLMAPTLEKYARGLDAWPFSLPVPKSAWHRILPKDIGRGQPVALQIERRGQLQFLMFQIEGCPGRSAGLPRIWIRCPLLLLFCRRRGHRQVGIERVGDALPFAVGLLLPDLNQLARLI